MEGLLPMVYRRIKNGRARQRRSSLSSDAYNIADFYPEGYNYRYPVGSAVATPPPPPPLLQLEMNTSINEGNKGGGLHRRWNSSVGDYYSSGDKSQGLEKRDHDMVKSNQQQLVRFRSSRTFFSCVTGGD